MISARYRRLAKDPDEGFPVLKRLPESVLVYIGTMS